jgi:hypothetical protein
MQIDRVALQYSERHCREETELRGEQGTEVPVPWQGEALSRLWCELCKL